MPAQSCVTIQDRVNSTLCHSTTAVQASAEPQTSQHPTPQAPTSSLVLKLLPRDSGPPDCDHVGIDGSETHEVVVRASVPIEHLELDHLVLQRPPRLVSQPPPLRLPGPRLVSQPPYLELRGPGLVWQPPYLASTGFCVNCDKD
eukprot:694704-Rhodomonas_salina.3